MKFLLAPFAFIFGVIARLRITLYDRGYLKSMKLAKPVISVGNITVGGTGKTPFVDILLTQLESENKKVGVLTRGYGRKSSAILKVEIDSDPHMVGDEPLWQKRRHPHVDIVVGADRVAASKLLSDVDVIILEDGMQHLKIQRDLEITLVDSTQADSDYKYLPQGRARENWNALNRSDVVAITKVNFTTEERADLLLDRVIEFGVWEILESQTVFECLWNLTDGSAVSEILRGKKVLLCSGIARPENFENLVKIEGAFVIDHIKLEDHAHFGDDAKQVNKFLENLQAKAKLKKADMILVTEKDGVKLGLGIAYAESPDLGIPIYVVSTKMTFSQELPSFYELATYNFN